MLPRLKNKLFFFGGFQRTSLRSDGSQNIALYSHACRRSAATLPRLRRRLATMASKRRCQPALGFVNNMIAPSLLSTVAVNMMKTFPVTANPCGRITYGLVADQDENLYVAKIDYQISDKHSIFGRFMAGHLAEASTYNGTNPLSINTSAYVNFDYGLNIGHTYIFSPNLISSFRIGANRTNVVKILDNYGSLAAFGSNMTPLGGNTVDVDGDRSFHIGGGNASLGANHNGPLPSILEDLSLDQGIASDPIRWGYIISNA